MDRIQPMPGPSLAVARRCEKALDDLFICVSAAVRRKQADFIGRRRKANEIERQATYQCAAIRFGRRRELLLLQFGKDESIEIIAWPARLHARHCRARGGFE